MQHQSNKRSTKRIERIKRFVRSELFVFSISSFAFILLTISLRKPIQTKSGFFIHHINTKEYRDLTYIRPFTSLVSFNWKFCKEVKSNEKKLSITLPFMN
jgi:hypothetical protein